jgi:hypothetical protein
VVNIPYELPPTPTPLKKIKSELKIFDDFFESQKEKKI